MCETQATKPKRCGKYFLKLVGKPKNYFKDTTFTDFTPFPKTYSFTNSGKKFKNDPFFQHTTMTKSSGLQLFSSHPYLSRKMRSS
jgi:hypothetical protein